MILKTLYAVEVALLALSIAVQYNDPDPIQWMVLYAIPLVLVIMAFVGRHSAISLLAIPAYLALALWSMPWGNLAGAFGGMPQWQMMSPENETLREAGGLFLCAVFLIGPAWQFLQKRRSAGEAGEPSQAGI